VNVLSLVGTARKQLGQSFIFLRRETRGIPSACFDSTFQTWDFAEAEDVGTIRAPDTGIDDGDGANGSCPRRQVAREATRVAIFDEFRNPSRRGQV
jgi:hypothetical protein